MRNYELSFELETLRGLGLSEAFALNSSIQANHLTSQALPDIILFGRYGVGMRDSAM